MALIQTGNELGTAILGALGIDSKNVLEVSIGMKPNELATVWITRTVTEAEAERIVKRLETYALVSTGETSGDMLRLPVVSMGVDKASAPDMTAMAAVSPKGEITIVNRCSVAVGVADSRTAAGERAKVLREVEAAVKGDLRDPNSSVSRALSASFAKGGETTSHRATDSIEPEALAAAVTTWRTGSERTSDPMEAVRAMSKGNGGGSSC